MAFLPLAGERPREGSDVDARPRLLFVVDLGAEGFAFLN